MTTNLSPYLFWITSRAAGIAALALASLAVALGLLMSTGLGKRWRADLRSTHEVLSLCTLGALVVHAVTLLGDAYLHPSVFDLAIPFVEGYQRFWTSLGIVAGWSLIVLGGAFYLRRRIGVARWRSLHRFTALAWIAGLAHSLGEGTDAGQAWFLAMVIVVAVPALVLLVARLAGMSPGRTAATAGQAPRAPGRPVRGAEAGRGTVVVSEPGPVAVTRPAPARLFS